MCEVRNQAVLGRGLGGRSWTACDSNDTHALADAQARMLAAVLRAGGAAPPESAQSSILDSLLAENTAATERDARRASAAPTRAKSLYDFAAEASTPSGGPASLARLQGKQPAFLGAIGRAHSDRGKHTEDVTLRAAAAGRALPHGIGSTQSSALKQRGRSGVEASASPLVSIARPFGGEGRGIGCDGSQQAAGVCGLEVDKGLVQHYLKCGEGEEEPVKLLLEDFGGQV